MRKIKVIIKRPDEEVGHVTNISDSLKNLQQIVDGYVELVSLDGETLVMLVNEEGTLRGLPHNFNIGIMGESIRGTVIVCGVKGKDFDDCPISLRTWKTLLTTWGNQV